MPDTLWYKYADGSGNVYQITHDNLRYAPITRMESSSLQYSGGDPASVSLAPDEFQSLQNLFDRLLLQTDIHIENRVMMSGLIVRNSNEETKEAILRPGTREILHIETTLHKLLKR